MVRRSSKITRQQKKIRDAFVSERTVEIIPAKREFTDVKTKKLRVAAYCRVSTFDESKSGSFELQKQTYTERINNTFYSEVPITRHLTNEEVTESYEWNTGKVIVEAFENQNLDPSAIPTVLVNGHGPFTWGTTTQKAIENSLVLNECCQTAQMTESVRSNEERLPQNVLDKHYYRNHGANAYYGQN